MDDRFVSLETLLGIPAGRPSPPRDSPARAVPTDADASARALAAELARDLSLIRAAAVERFECAAVELLTSFARDVLGRESRAAPSELAALAARAVAAIAAHEPLAVVVAPDDAASLAGTSLAAALPIRADASLATGDLIVEVRDGAFESRVAFRTARAVAAAFARGAA